MYVQGAIMYVQGAIVSQVAAKSESTVGQGISPERGRVIHWYWACVGVILRSRGRLSKNGPTSSPSLSKNIFINYRRYHQNNC